MNPIGITSWIWTSPLTTERFPEIAQHVARLGFDLLEVPIESTTDLDYEQAAGVVKELGLQTSVCAAMSPDRDLIHSDESVRKNAMAYVRHCVDAAQTLGAANVVGPLYSAVGRTWQATADERKRDVDLLVKELKELSAYAHERGVVLCVEPLNRFETSFLNLASQAIEIADAVGHPGCGLLLDTFHMNIEEDSFEGAMRAAGKRLAHTHFADNNRKMPGSGHIDFGIIVRCLQDIGYSGYASFEPNIADGSYGRDTKRGLEFMRRIEAGVRKAATA